jgi:hypothetical protein
MKVLLVIGIIGYGLWLISFAAWNAMRCRESRSWPKADIRISRVVVSSRQKFGAGETGPLPVYFPEVEYAYEVGGVSYRSSSIYIDPKGAESYSQTEAEQLAQLVAQKGQCLYDPRLPERSVLISGLSKGKRSHLWALGLGGGLLVIAGSGLLFFLVDWAV